MLLADESISFGTLLQRHRRLAGLSQVELAARAGLSRRGISDLERGVRRFPYPTTVRGLAAALGLDEVNRTALVVAARPARTAASVQHNLPAQPTRLIGREQDLGEVEVRLLQPEVRLLTLTGAGGSG